MKRIIFSCSALVVLCASSVAFADDGPRAFQSAEIRASEIAPGIFSSAEGAAWLKRSENRVDGRVMAKVDKADTPYTIWWVIFNNPDACELERGCGPWDLMRDGGADADVAIFNAGGAISAASGSLKRNGKPAEGGVINIDISAIAGEGAGKGAQNPPMGAGGPWNRKLNMKNGLCAEIHVDLNQHEFSGDWVQELTYPESPQAFSIFPAAEGCSED